MPNSKISLVGVPFDAKSSFLTGSSEGPHAIRQTLFSGVSNLYSEIGVDLDNVDGFRDLIDLKIDNSDDGYIQIEKEVAKELSDNAIPIFLGGDHSITYPLVKAVAKSKKPTSILSFFAPKN